MAVISQSRVGIGRLRDDLAKSSRPDIRIATLVAGVVSIVTMIIVTATHESFKIIQSSIRIFRPSCQCIRTRPCQVGVRHTRLHVMSEFPIKILQIPGANPPRSTPSMHWHFVMERNARNPRSVRRELRGLRALQNPTPRTP